MFKLLLPIAAAAFFSVISCTPPRSGLDSQAASSTGVSPPVSASSSENEWSRVLRAARKEGKLAVISTAGPPVWFHGRLPSVDKEENLILAFSAFPAGAKEIGFNTSLIKKAEL